PVALLSFPPRRSSDLYSSTMSATIRLTNGSVRLASSSVKYFTGLTPPAFWLWAWASRPLPAIRRAGDTPPDTPLPHDGTPDSLRDRKSTRLNSSHGSI